MDYPFPQNPTLLLKEQLPLLPLDVLEDTIRVELKKLIDVPDLKISNAEDVVEYMKDMSYYDREYARILCLNTQNHLVGVNTISIGSVDSAIVHPREVFKPVFLTNSSAIIFVHNHPSGSPDPSAEDISTVDRLGEICKLSAITLLDSVIIGANKSFSFRENNTKPFGPYDSSYHGQYTYIEGGVHKHIR